MFLSDFFCKDNGISVRSYEKNCDYSLQSFPQSFPISANDCKDAYGTFLFIGIRGVNGFILAKRLLTEI